MIVTEKEAAGMQCVLDQGTISGACVGSKCMAWRWAEPVAAPHVIRCSDRNAEMEPTPRPAHVPEGYVFHPAECGDFAYWSAPITNDGRTGYCGLAGTPFQPRIKGNAP